MRAAEPGQRAPNPTAALRTCAYEYVLLRDPVSWSGRSEHVIEEVDQGLSRSVS